MFCVVTGRNLRISVVLLSPGLHVADAVILYTWSRFLCLITVLVYEPGILLDLIQATQKMRVVAQT